MTDEELIARLREIQGQAGLFASAAADRIEALVKDNRELVLQGLADSGQAQEAYEAQLKAEAQIAALTARVEGLTGAGTDAADDWEECVGHVVAALGHKPDWYDHEMSSIADFRAALSATEEGRDPQA